MSNYPRQPDVISIAPLHQSDSPVGNVGMKHPGARDFDTSVTEAGVTVTFKPTNKYPQLL